MNYYVNLYRLPETQCREHCDNLTIGQLCRSLIEARNDAITHSVLAIEEERMQYMGTINDPQATIIISDWINQSANALQNFLNLGNVWPKDVQAFFDYWEAAALGSKRLAS